MITWKRLIAACCALFVVFVAFTMLALPDILRSKAEQWVADNTGRVLTIGDISFNPFTLTVEIGPLALSETDQSRRFAAWENLRVVLSPTSLYHLAPVLREIRLVEPYLHLERLEEGRFNFSDLLPAPSQTEPAKAEAEPVRFSLNNILIEKGCIELVDRSVADSIEHRVRDLNLSIPFIGNLPYLVEEPVQPRFSAVINDSPIDLKGDLTPFAENREFSLRLDLADIDLPYYLAYLPIDLPIELRSGRLGFDLQLRYRAGMTQKPDLLVSGIVNLTALNIRDKQNEQLFFMPLLRAVVAPSHPLEKDLHFSSLDIYNLAVNVVRDQNGVWNHSRLKIAEDAGKEKSDTAAEESQPFNVRVDTFQVHDSEVYFADQLPAEDFATEIRNIYINIDDFALNSREPAPFHLSLTTAFDETLAVEGRFLVDPLTVALQTEANNLHMGAYAPYYADAYALPLGGKVHLRANLDINPQQPLLISAGAIEWQDVSLAFTDQEGVAIERIDVTGLSFNLAENRLEVDSARTSNGRVNFSRDSRGQWTLLSHNFPILAEKKESPETRPAAAQSQKGREFSYLINELVVSNWSFDIQDRQPTNPVQLQASKFNLKFSNLAAPQNVQSPFEFSTTFGNRGTIELKGTTSLAGKSAGLDARIGRISLATFAPYVSEQANLVLRDGTFDARLKVSVQPGPENFQVSFGGDLGVSRLYLLDGTYREDLLTWDSLQIAGIDGRWAPLDLSIASVTMSDYFAKVFIDENAQLNFMKVFKEGDGGTGTSSEAEDPTGTNAAAPEPGAEPPADIRVKQVILQGGQVDFTDLSLPRPFHADMRELGGSILGLNSDRETRAGIDLRGKLLNQSPLVIEGEINPLAEDLYLDLKLSFSDIEMSPMSPYSGTYLGYLIEKGKLNLALEYHVEDGKLKASNNVFLDQFTFGEPFKSDKSVGLPVKLAVALLKDRNGEIHLDIPVSGELDDPQFNIAGVIWKIIRNLLVKAATSPLALLGALAGGGDEDFRSVEFAFGTAELAEPEQEKLSQLGDALLNRPSLRLEVKGFVDPENDPEGYRREQLRRKIERARRLDPARKQDPPEEPAPMTREEYSEYLWAVYKEEDFPKPRNFVGMTKHLADEELEKLIYTNTKVGPEALEQLARQRAQTVRSYLVEQAGVAPERIFLTAADTTLAPAKAEDVRSRVEFDISVK